MRAPTPPPSPYHKDVPSKIIDVYRVLVAFGVTDPCIQHAVKKLLCPGQRKGGKTIARDVHEALWSLQRWEEMRAEEAAGLLTEIRRLIEEACFKIAPSHRGPLEAQALSFGGGNATPDGLAWLKAFLAALPEPVIEADAAIESRSKRKARGK